MDCEPVTYGHGQAALCQLPLRMILQKDAKT